MSSELTLKYVGPSAGVKVGADTVARGKTVTVPVEFGEGLLAQGCSPAHTIVLAGGDELAVPEDRSGAQWEKTKKQPKPDTGGEGSS